MGTATPPATSDASSNAELSVDTTEPYGIGPVNSDASPTSILATDRPDALSKPESTSQRYRPTIIGVSIAVPLGLLGLGLLFYIRRRYREDNLLHTPTVHFPPDHIYYTDNQVIAKAELDTCPNAIAELDEPIELDASETAINAMPDPRNRNSVTSELEGSAGIPSALSNRISAAVAANEVRWSDVSSLAPSQAQDAATARPSIAETLSIVSQQQHGSGQDVFLTPPRPHASHRLSRPTSGFLPDIEIPEEHKSLTPQSSIIGANKQSTRDEQEGKHANTVQEEGHEGEQLSISETAHTGDEAAQAGQNAEVGRNSHAVNTVNDGNRSYESATNAQTGEIAEVGEESHGGQDVPGSKDSNESGSEAQTGGAVQVDENCHEAETVDECKDPHENGMKAQACEDTHKSENRQQSDTPTLSGE